jgi:hypothetical protein
LRFGDRVLIGIVLILLSLVILWWGSPDRSGAFDSPDAFKYLFIGFFAVGFIIGAMGLMGSEEDYPALLSGLVLYFVVGGLVAVLVYVNSNGIGSWTIEDARFSGFWVTLMRLAATWPMVAVQRLGLLGYQVP